MDDAAQAPRRRAGKRQTAGRPHVGDQIGRVDVDAGAGSTRQPALAHDTARRGAHEARRRLSVLVIDIGGSNVKVFATTQRHGARFASKVTLTPELLVHRVKRIARSWRYDVISIGYPGDVAREVPVAEPGNLGDGWVNFDFRAAFGRPVRVVNDAVLQAIGAYEGGRMLFLGLGTGVGSALIVDRVIVPLELGRLSYGRRDTVADRLGKGGLDRFGARAWHRAVEDVARTLRTAFRADYVVLGGGSAKKLKTLPRNALRGGNSDAFVGGIRLWEDYVDTSSRPARVWKVLR